MKAELSDAEVLAAIVAHQKTDSSATLANKIKVGVYRIERIAKAYGIILRQFNASPGQGKRRKGGNTSRMKTEQQILNEAYKLQGSRYYEAAKTIKTSYYRLLRIAKKYGLNFTVGEDSLLSREDIEKAIREHNFDHSYTTLARKIGVGTHRVKQIAQEMGVEMAHLRKKPDLAGLINDEGYYKKRCRCCNETRGVEFFTEDSTKVDGFSSWCKQCKKSSAALKRTLEALLT